MTTQTKQRRRTQSRGYMFARVPEELVQELDQAVKVLGLNRSDLAREGVEILLRIPLNHVQFLRRYGRVKGVLLSGLIREAVEEYVSRRHDEFAQAIKDEVAQVVKWEIINKGKLPVSSNPEQPPPNG